MNNKKLKFGIKNKSLLLFSVIFIIFIMITIYIGLSTLYKVKKSTIETGNKILINQSKEYYSKYTNSQKEILNILIKNIEADVYNLQDFTKKLYLNKKIIDTKKYWNHKEHLIHLPNNQLTEKITDISTLWTPTWMKVNDKVLTKIEISSYLNEYFEPLLKRNKNTVANYFLGTEGFLRYYPRVNMLELFPPNFRTIDDIYFLPATPKFNPERKLLWTPLYNDPAEQGLMISAIAPVYIKEKFIGVVGTDLTLNNLVEHYINENKQGYSLLLDNNFKPIALPKKAINDIYKDKTNSELFTKSLLDYNSDFKEIFNEIKKTKNGFKKMVLNKKVVYISYSKLDKVGWIYIDVLYADEIFKVTEILNNNIDSIITQLVKNFLVPTILCFLFFIFLISLLINKFLEPIIKLSDVTKVIAIGDIEKEITLKSRDEIGILISNFKIMQKSIIKQQKKLKRFNNTLQGKVYERTQELEESNDELEQTITNLKIMQKKLIESEKMASLGNLVAGVAHEINTPVGIGITGITHFLSINESIRKKYESDDMTQEEFENYLKASNDLATMINHNLDRTADLVKSFKRIAIDQTNEDKRTFNLKEYVENVLLSLNTITKKTNITISLRMSDDIEINSYPGFYSQIITNLIINSIRHGFDDKQIGDITIEANIKDKTLLLVYSDNGKGISKENLPKIFEPFYTTNREKGGTGLGLNVIYNIITNNLNGSIICTSKNQKGVLFEIKLSI